MRIASRSASFLRALAAPAALVAVVVGAGPVAAAQATPPGTLTVVSAGPSGEVESLGEAREIRIVFSEPMVTLGKIPAQVAAFAGRCWRVVRWPDPRMFRRWCSPRSLACRRCCGS